MSRVLRHLTAGIGTSRAAPRPYRNVLIAAAMLAIFITAMWLLIPQNSHAGEQARPVHISDGANVRRPSADSPEQLNAKAIAELEETREMVAKMKAHGIGG